MFSLQIVDTDAFLDMPQSSQLLYFHLAMRADDEGFMSSPKRIMKMIGSSDDDLKVLTAKKFIINFESGVCVIKHWLIHNTIRMDRFGGTTHIKEKEQLLIKDNKAYKLVELQGENEMATIRQPNGNQMVPQVKLSKDKISKDNTETSSVEIAELIKSFETINPASKRFYGRKVQRDACESLIKEYGYERVKAVIEKTLLKTNTIQFFPSITTPLQLFEKWAMLESAIRKYQSKEKEKVDKYPVI